MVRLLFSQKKRNRLMLSLISIERYDYFHAYEALNNHLRPGDLLFSRSDTWVGNIIQWSSHCPWNHVAIVLSMNDELHILEASPSTSIIGKNGIRLYSIREFAKYLQDTLHEDFLKSGENSKFTFGIAKLEKDLSSNLNNQIITLYSKIKNYKYSYKDVIRAWYDGWDTILNTCQLCGRRFSRKREEENNDREGMKNGNHEDEEKYFFCSELVVYILRNIFSTKFKTIDKEYTVGNLADISYLNKNLIDIKYNETMVYLVIDTLIY